MDNVNVILMDLPPKVKGMLVKTFDGEECYTVVLNSRLNKEQQLSAYEHEMEHMDHGDFVRECQADEIEWVRHMGAVS